MPITRIQVNTDISTKITSKTTAGSLTNTEDGANRVLMMDYVDQEVASVGGGTKTAGAINLSVTPIVLPYDMNSCSFTGGIAYLPATTEINREIYVIATANNIEIRANVANTAKMFVNYPTFVTSVILTTNQMYRFIYIGFASDGYWKAEQI